MSSPRCNELREFFLLEQDVPKKSFAGSGQLRPGLARRAELGAEQISPQTPGCIACAP